MRIKNARTAAFESGLRLAGGTEKKLENLHSKHQNTRPTRVQDTTGVAVLEGWAVCAARLASPEER
jgi:hypothetical protein